ncbi:MAG: ABC transporter ATP-binding protein/permease [Bacteroidales bacterium]|nr:ABC transporter ATP-binding protein/permease [Bacteroidales bacterium]
MLKAFKLIWKCDSKRFLLKLVYTLFNSLLPLVNLYVLKVLVDVLSGTVSGGAEWSTVSETIVSSVLLFCGISLANRMIGVLGVVNDDVLTQELVDYINKLIQEQSVRLDMAYYDNPNYHDTFHRAQQEAAFRPVRIMESLVSLFGSVVSLLGVTAMLVAASWQVIVVMVLAIVPTFCVRLYKSRSIYRFRRETTQESRRGSYYGLLMTNRIYAKEVRTLGLAGFFRKMYVDTRFRLVTQLKRISRRLAVMDGVTAVVEAAAMGVVVLVLVRPVANGALTIGTFVMLFEAFRRGQGYLTSMVSSVTGLYEHKLFINNLFDFLDLRPSIVSPSEPEPFPAKVEEVVFDNITFAYPDMNQPVLSRFSLVARYGEVTLIEGENGFGKTTLLKLLMRLYDPQEGCVSINGTDVRRFDLSELRRNVSVMFQDYVQFYFTARENVEFGDIGGETDSLRMSESLRQSGADKVVSRLAKGLDTQLGRQFEGGEELSMGQWQRIALARELYSRSQVLAFDEPTAWMDASGREAFRKTLEELKPNHVVILVRHSEL